MPCSNFINADMQNAYYEGYTPAVEVSNLVVWIVVGKIIHTAITFLRSWHDNKIAHAFALVTKKLNVSRTTLGKAILRDNAFVANLAATNGKLLRPRKANQTSGIPEGAVLAAVD